MARKLSNKVNVDPISGAYPYGRVKDNPGDNTGTPMDELLLGDLIQFFEKLMDASGITFNNQPESNTNGFQFISALRQYIRQTSATTTEKGTSTRASQSDVNTGTDLTSFVSPGTLSGRTATETRSGVIELATQTETNAGTDNERALTAFLIANATSIIGLAAMKVNSVDSPQYVDGSIDPEHLADGTAVKITSGTPQLSTKVIEIGDWNMDTTASVSIPHGLTAANIRTLNVIIRNDAATTYSPSPATDDFLQFELAHNYGVTNVAINRPNGGIFDSVLYDSTGFNRGWITITYEA